MKRSLLSRCVSVLMAVLMMVGMINFPTFSVSVMAEEKTKSIFPDDDTTPRSSGEGIAPGTYTVTANIYVGADNNAVLGCNAYFTNPDNPFGGKDDENATDVNETIPNTPRYNNAKVTINADGTARLIMPVRNIIFTLQELGQSKDVTVNNIKRNDVDYQVFTGRIVELDLTLNNLSGEYIIDNCKAWPAIFDTPWNVPLRIAVDFQNNQVPKTYSYTADNLDMKIDVSTTTNIEGASLTVNEITSGAEYDAVGTSLKNIQVKDTSTEPTYKFYDIKLTKDGKDVELAKNSTISIKKSYVAKDGDFSNIIEAMGYENNSAGYSYSNGELKTQYASTEESDDMSEIYTILKTDETGKFVFVTNAKDSLVKFNKTWTNSKENIALTYTSTLNSSAVEYDELYNKDVPKSLFSDINREDDKATALTAFGRESVGKIDTYRMNISSMPFSAESWGKQYHTSMTYTVPAATDKSLGGRYVYLVTVDGENTTLEKLSSTEADGMLTINVIPEELKNKDQKSRMQKLGYGIEEKTGNTASGEAYSYVAVIYDTCPVVEKGLVYNGTEQTGVLDNEAYTLSGDYKAVNAGNYKATVTLKDGYVWSDGDTNRTKTIEWNISKATLKAKYVNEIVNTEAEATYKVDVTGFIGDDTEENALGYKAPTVNKPELQENVHTYKLMPAGGESVNYDFVYEEGYLNIGLNAVDKPVYKNQYYNGKDIEFAAENQGYTRTGDYHGKDAGKYSYTVTLNDGYVWSDGTLDVLNNQASIYKAYVRIGIESVESEFGKTPEFKLRAIEGDGIWTQGLAENETIEGLLESGDLTWDKTVSYGWPKKLEDGSWTTKIDPKNVEAKNYDIWSASGNDEGVWTMTSIRKTLDNGKTTINDKRTAEIVEQINAANDGDTVVIYDSQNMDIIPQAILDAAKGKNVNINIKSLEWISDKYWYSWTFNGMDINNTVDEPFPVRMYSSSEYKFRDYVTDSMIKDIVGSTPYETAFDYHSALKYEGTLPFKVDLKLEGQHFGTSAKNKYAAIYQCDWKTENNKFELITSGIMSDENDWTFYFTVDKPCIIEMFKGTVDFSKEKVEIPVANEGLIYNGSEQTGVEAGEGYTLSDNAKATEAGTYTVTATLEDGRRWSDDSIEEKEITYTIAEKQDNKSLDPGTYKITANLYVAGSDNTVLGVNAYLTNPNNPIGIVPDGFESVEPIAPITPVADNATIVVGEDGSQTLVLDVVNPVFTLQQIKTSDNADVLATVKDTKRYEGNNKVGRDGRITKVYIKLNDNSGVYKFKDCLEFPTLLEEEWNVPLTLDVDFINAVRLSDETKVELPDDNKGNDNTGDNTGDNDNKGDNTGDNDNKGNNDNKNDNKSDDNKGNNSNVNNNTNTKSDDNNNITDVNKDTKSDTSKSDNKTSSSKENVKTGDTNKAFVYAGIMLVAVMAASVTVVVSKKRRKYDRYEQEK